jgi:hypothetical protein
MGLPGSGKTYFAERLKQYLEQHGTINNIDHNRFQMLEAWTSNNQVRVDWINADEIRRRFNDWDFSKDGRIRQSLRMLELALKSPGDYSLCDFVAALPEQRANFKADWCIWMDTITAGRYEDTNREFVPPDVYDFRITEKNAERWVEFVGEHILDGRRRPRFDFGKPTVQMLGSWQPWHEGHRAVFERAIAKTGQVVIMIRDCQGWNQSDQFTVQQVQHHIRRDLDPLYQGQYHLQIVPNIVDIAHGRDVGYTIEQETFDEETAEISSAAVRAKMGLQ